MDALILAGGLGTRLAPVVSDRAKPVADVGGRPFLTLVLAQLAKLAEVRRVILCVGHMAPSVESALGPRFGRLAIEYSRESRPLGTGGALRLAVVRMGLRAPLLAMNGDTWFPVALDRLVGFHRTQRPAATMAIARVEDSARFGAVRIAGTRVAGFTEKGEPGAGWINGGIYVLGKGAVDALECAPEAFSLEREVLPALAAAGKLAAYRSRSRFIDIGIPEDYARARRLLAGVARSGTG
jgi:D-glycero-alpha-D-manno-heptose 1-phosphate guanylyltransferase